MKIVTVLDKEGEAENVFVCSEITEFLTIFMIRYGLYRCDCCSTDLSKHSNKVYTTFSNWHFCQECFNSMVKNKMFVVSDEEYIPGEKHDGLFSLQNIKTREFFEADFEFTKKIYCGICGNTIHIKNNIMDIPLCRQCTQKMLNMKDVSTQEEFVELLRKIRTSGTIIEVTQC